MAHLTEAERAKAWRWAYLRVDALERRLRGCGRGWMDIEPFYTRAGEAVERAAGSWNPEGGSTWQAWAFVAVRHAIQREYGRQMERRVVLDLAELDSPLTNDVEARFLESVPDPVADDPEERMLLTDDLRRVESALPHLHPTLRRVMEMRMQGATLKEIAQETGGTKQGVQMQERRAIAALRRMLCDSSVLGLFV